MPIGRSSSLMPWALLPATLAAAVVLHSFADNAIPIQALVRPLLVAVVVSLLLGAVVGLVAGSPRGPVVLTLAILVLLIHADGRLDASLAALVVLGLVYMDLRYSVPWLAIARPMLTVSTVLLALSVGRIALAADAIADDLRSLSPPTATYPAAPDIYLILLDGYPRSDMLKSVFDYDNSAFIDALGDLGFDHYADSRSNYPSTTLTTASVLRGGEVSDVPPGQPDLRFAAWDAPLIELARARGYEFVTIASGWDELSLRRADRFIDSGELGQFEQSLIERNGIGFLVDVIGPDYFGGQRRDRIESVLRTVSELAAEEHSRPRLVWAHVPAPHYPMVYGPGGLPREVEIAEFDYYDTRYPDFVSDYTANLAGLNEKVLGAVRAMTASDPIVVLWSDHGSLTRLGPPEELVRNFLAARTPQHSRLFGSKPSPMQLIPRLLNTYLGIAIDVPPSRSYIFGGSRQELQPIEP